jgi:hypothetical protein
VPDTNPSDDGGPFIVDTWNRVTQATFTRPACTPRWWWKAQSVVRFSGPSPPPCPIVQIDDQFGTQTTDLGRVARFMVPADKNDEGLFDPISHLTCYRITDGVAGPPVISTNQFGVQPLTLGNPDSLCVPTEKLISPGLVDVDHYKCYLAAGAPIDVGVSLIDQFQGRSTLVLDPELFCTPADKNGEGIDDPITHLTCYQTNPIGGAPGLIPILNQFVAGDQLQLLGPDLVCAPSTKEAVPPQVPTFSVWGLGSLALVMMGTALLLGRRPRSS